MSAPPGGNPPGEVLSLRLPSRPEAAHAARRRVRELGFNDETRDLLSLLVTELVTNATRHATADGAREIELRVRRTGRVVRVDVRNEGDSFAWRRRPPVSPSQPGGLGLVLVDRLARRWGVSGGAGTRVWLEVPAR